MIKSLGLLLYRFLYLKSSLKICVINCLAQTVEHMQLKHTVPPSIGGGESKGLAPFKYMRTK
jgi:hypothetical protein